MSPTKRKPRLKLRIPPVTRPTLAAEVRRLQLENDALRAALHKKNAALHKRLPPIASQPSVAPPTLTVTPAEVRLFSSSHLPKKITPPLPLPGDDAEHMLLSAENLAMRGGGTWKIPSSPLCFPKVRSIGSASSSHAATSRPTTRQDERDEAQQDHRAPTPP